MTIIAAIFTFLMFAFITALLFWVGNTCWEWGVYSGGFVQAASIVGGLTFYGLGSFSFMLMFALPIFGLAVGV